MPEQDNFWDGSKWVDQSNGNYMVPTDAGGDGIWRNPNGGTWNGSAWSDQTTPAGTLNTYAGLPLEMQARDHASSKYNTDQQAGANRYATETQAAINREEIAANRDLAAKEDATRRYISDLENRTQMDIASLDARTRETLQRREMELQRDLLERRINAEKYMQERTIAQQESEFARQLALNTIIADRDYEINQATVELNRLAEIRQERELQAQLAANPTDFVAYEFYKRSLGNPQAWDTAQRASQGGTATAVGTNSTFTGDPNMLGEPYAAAPPAYSDETIQQVAGGLFNQQPGQQYNPNLGGTGVFGANIQSPNQMSRAEGAALSDQEMGILSSFLKAGVETGNGQRVSVDPAEYFQQAEQSWIPTLANAGTMAQYR